MRLVLEERCEKLELALDCIKTARSRLIELHSGDAYFRLGDVLMVS